MAVSPLGNITYINQNMQSSSIQHANAQQRMDFQALVNLQEMDEKQQEIEAVRPTEETDALNEDREKEKEEFHSLEQEEKEQKEAHEEDGARSSLHILDIKA
ncbi:MAG: hypothetical protein ACTTH5_01825 [Wolinella sp.]